HVEGGGGGAFLFVAPHVEVAVVGAPVGESVDQPGVAVVGEDDRPVGGQEGVELGVAQAVGMFAPGLEGHEVDHVDDPDAQLRAVAPQQVDGGQRLEGG